MLTVEHSQPPRLTEYTDYHEFLHAFYVYKKKQNANFSYRHFAKLAGIKSSNFLMLVMRKERRLSAEMARAVAKAMKLAKPESDYFTAMVKMELCRNPEERQEFERECSAAICKIMRKVLPQEKAEYLSTWYYPLVRELAFLPDFSLSAKWISKKMGGSISVDQAEKALEVLFHLGLWKLNPAGKVVVSDTFVDTGPEDRAFGEVKIVQIHEGNLKVWAQIIADVPAKDRELGLLNIPINAKKIPELKKRMQRFQDEIIGWLQDETEPTQIVQLGTYLVPMTTDTLDN